MAPKHEGPIYSILSKGISNTITPSHVEKTPPSAYIKPWSYWWSSGRNSRCILDIRYCIWGDTFYNKSSLLPSTKDLICFLDCQQFHFIGVPESLKRAPPITIKANFPLVSPSTLNFRMPGGGEICKVTGSFLGNPFERKMNLLQFILPTL